MLFHLTLLNFLVYFRVQFKMLLKHFSRIISSFHMLLWQFYFLFYPPFKYNGGAMLSEGASFFFSIQADPSLLCSNRQ